MLKINAIILAGGQSRRMGENKAFLPLGESTFIHTLIQTLKPLVNQIIISGSRERYESLGYTVVEDKHINCGPLSGVLAGLNYSDCDWNLVVSVDTPFINEYIINQLKTQINDQQVIFAETAKRQMPLIGLYHKSCKASIANALANKNLKVMHVLNTLKTEQIMIQEPHHTLLTNINTPQEYKEGLTTILVRFFGQLAEITGKQETTIVLPYNATILQVKNQLFKEFKGLEYKTYKVALNNNLVNDADLLTKDAKIDFLPAFAGG